MKSSSNSRQTRLLQACVEWSVNGSSTNVLLAYQISFEILKSSTIILPCGPYLIDLLLAFRLESLSADRCLTVSFCRSLYPPIMFSVNQPSLSRFCSCVGNRYFSFLLSLSKFPTMERFYSLNFARYQSFFPDKPG